MRSRRTVPATFGILVLGITAIVGTFLGIGWSGGVPHSPAERIVAAGLPRDVPLLGMVYDGLAPSEPGSVCNGAYQVGPQTCTHGPGPPPPGLDVHRGIDPVTGRGPGSAMPVAEPARVTPDADILRDSGGSAAFPGAPSLIPDAAEGDADFVLGPHGVACDGDGQTGKRVQALYAYERGTPSRYQEFAGSIRNWASGVDAIVDASAADTGGSRHVRFATTPDCAVDVTEVQLPAGSLDSFTRSIDALGVLGYNRTDRKYLIFADAAVYCSIGTYIPDGRPGFGNRNNGGPSYGRVDAGCWGPMPGARELGQMLGALRPDTRAGDCVARIDCDHEAFFSTDPRPGSYLATHWNAASNEFLLSGDGGDSGTGTASVQAAVEVRDPTSSAVRLMWSTAGPGVEYRVAVDGRPVGATRATRARLIGLRPDTSYTVTVENARLGYRARSTGRTAPAARPAPGSWFVLTNALTGGAAGLYAARADDGTPITLGDADGGAPEQWRLDPAVGGGFTLRSRVTGRCVLPLGGVAAPGEPLVQGDCAAPGVPRWILLPSDHGYTLRTAAGGLVLGVGGQRFGGDRVLTLQTPAGARQQSWTAAPS